MQQPAPIHSRDNPLVKQLHKLAKDGGSYRKLGQVWLEGEHLLGSYLQQWTHTPAALPAPAKLLLAESRAAQLPQILAAHGLSQAPCPVLLLADALWPAISSVESPALMGLLLAAPPAPPPIQAAPTIVLDRLQDAGNVGTILRSAAAFGFTQVLALKGTVALWSPKVLRAGMGAHFGLQLREGLEAEATLAALQNLQLPLLATSSHQGDFLHQAQLPAVGAWLMGHEGQGLSALWQTAANQHIRIWQHSQESLNVAVAAAICLHQHGLSMATQHAPQGSPA